MLEIDEHTHGKVYTTYIPCEISGKQAERTAIELEAGDVVQISGKWKYKSSVDAKTGAKVSKPLVSSWGIQQREAAHVPQDEPARPDATPETSAATSVAPEPKPRRP